MVVIEVTPTAPGTAINVASVAGANTNVAQAVTVTQVLGPATIVVSKTDNPDPAFVGGTLTLQHHGLQLRSGRG